jgi:hypothetical protein
LVCDDKNHVSLDGDEPVLWVLKKGLLMLSLGVLTACDEPVLPDDLVGEYELVLGSTSFSPQNGFSSGRLTVHADGTFQQRCRFATQPDRVTIGVWQLRSEWIMLTDFDDCLDLYHWSVDDPTNKTINVPLEGNRISPLILLEPDLNVFYEKLHE